MSCCDHALRPRVSAITLDDGLLIEVVSGREHLPVKFCGLPPFLTLQRISYKPKITIVALPVSGMAPPLLPDATATYCLPLFS